MDSQMITAVISPRFCAPDEIHLTMVRKVMAVTEGNFTVTDDKGKIMFNMKEKLLSVHGRHLLQDAEGTPIVTLKKKILSAHRRWQVFKGDSSKSGDLVFSAKKSSIIQLKTEIVVFLANKKDENSWDFKVVGSWLERSCVIYDGKNNVIARMQKKHTFCSFVTGKDTFSVSIYPNVDTAFIVALLVILYEINEDKDD